METGKYLIEKIFVLSLFLVFTSETLTLVGKGLLTTSGVIASQVSRKEATLSEYDFLSFSHQQDKGSVTGVRFDQLWLLGGIWCCTGNLKTQRGGLLADQRDFNEMLRAAQAYLK